MYIYIYVKGLLPRELVMVSVLSVVVIHYLYYLAFGLARLLSQLNHTKTPKPQLVLEITSSTSGYSLFHAIIYSYIYITTSSKRILVYHTAFKLYRRAFNTSTN